MNKFCNSDFCNFINKRIKAAILTAICMLSMSVTAFASTGTPTEKGPGVASGAEASAEAPQEGVSLGIFTTTGYCNCSKCSGGSGLTASGTAPQANHTISSDWNILPAGSRVRIGSMIYTVEDMGSSVDGHKVDIYYSSHEEALAHGIQQAEVFLIEKPEEKAAAETPTTGKTSDSPKGPGIEPVS